MKYEPNLKKHYLREFCNKCFKSTRQTIHTKIQDENKIEYTVTCDECSSRLFVVKDLNEKGKR